MDQAIPWAKRLKKNMKVSAYVLTVISALTFSFFGFRNMITPQLTEGEYETSTV
jgi:hypothetical protein